jgi:hypothetical protein
VTLYKDATCTLGLEGLEVSSKTMWGCSDMPTGDALRGKTATTPVYEPGACEPSGGEPLGSVELLGPSTFCCGDEAARTAR